ncbi:MULTISPECIES: hypothetical protein [Aquincola]|uniref:hypothetical protein n=1 Tax=Aquincola TaxID=391952 RepID=UPI000614FA0D|nr:MULTISPECIES: hypothetical protein [Aquincola]MCR5865554.1 hypothetical protein [Aquincola sp. J276]
MANLTIAVDDDLLRQARIKAVQDGTSVNEVCRRAIERYALEVADTPASRLAKLRGLAARANGFEPGPAWPGREALYEEALSRGKAGR